MREMAVAASFMLGAGSAGASAERAPSAASNAPPAVSNAPSAASNAPPAASNAPSAASNALPRVSNAPSASPAPAVPSGVPAAPNACGASAVPASCSCACSDPAAEAAIALRTERWLEASFGSAQKFFDQSVSDPTGFVKSRTIPVNTVRVLGEWLAGPRWSVMAMFDLPLEPRTAFMDGVLVEQYVPPELSGGLRWSVFAIPVPDHTVFEGQVMLLLGSTLASIGTETVFPSLGWRAHLRDDEGFTLYAGTSYEFSLNVLALTYGVGHRF
jgi:hypothetical protein